MVLINQSTKEITVKLVYYGPGLCGKTTNLEYIYQKGDPSRKGKLLSVATETDRTLFFDFLPMDLGTVKGMKVRCQLYTVPGQVFYDATRRLVLRGADGIIFVADSQEQMLDANIESLENLKVNLGLNSLDPDAVPLVMQYNKRDLPNVLSMEDLDKELNWRRAPSFGASAVTGEGVFETFKKALELIIRAVQSNAFGGGKPAAPAKAAEIPAAPPPVPESVLPAAQPEELTGEPEVVEVDGEPEVEMEPQQAPPAGMPAEVRAQLLQMRGTLVKQMRDVEAILSQLEAQQAQIEELLKRYP